LTSSTGSRPSERRALKNRKQKRKRKKNQGSGINLRRQRIFSLAGEKYLAEVGGKGEIGKSS